MSDQERGEARAAGAFETFLQQMRDELDAKHRSDEYRLNFWAGLYGEMNKWAKEKL